MYSLKQIYIGIIFGITNYVSLISKLYLQLQFGLKTLIMYALLNSLIGSQNNWNTEKVILCCLLQLSSLKCTVLFQLLDTTLCDKVCQWLAAGRWFSLDTPVSFTNKTDLYDTTKILLKVALNTITLTPYISRCKRMDIPIVMINTRNILQSRSIYIQLIEFFCV